MTGTTIDRGRIAERLAEGASAGNMRTPGGDLDTEVRAWAVMGINVFLGLRFGVWGKEDAGKVAAVANRLLREGLAAD